MYKLKSAAIISKKPYKCFATVIYTSNGGISYELFASADIENEQIQDFSIGFTKSGSDAQYMLPTKPLYEFLHNELYGEFIELIAQDKEQQAMEALA